VCKGKTTYKKCKNKFEFSTHPISTKSSNFVLSVASLGNCQNYDFQILQTFCSTGFFYLFLIRTNYVCVREKRILRNEQRVETSRFMKSRRFQKIDSKGEKILKRGFFFYYSCGGNQRDGLRRRFPTTVIVESVPPCFFTFFHLTSNNLEAQKTRKSKNSPATANIPSYLTVCCTQGRI